MEDNNNEQKQENQKSEPYTQQTNRNYYQKTGGYRKQQVTIVKSREVTRIIKEQAKEY